MKKVFTAVLSIIMVFTSTACQKKENKTEVKASKENFDINIATNILDSYMGYIYAGDLENAKKLYSEKLMEEGVVVYSTDLKILGYNTEEINEVGRSGVFKVKIARSVPEKTIAVLDSYSIKVELEEKDYKITEINANTEKEAFLEGEGLRLRDKNNVKNNLIVDMGGIPYYTFPKDDNGKLGKAPVPRKKFGMMVFNYSGEKIAITTTDNESTYIGIVKINETQAAHGGGGGSGNGGAGGGGGDGGGNGAGGSNTIVKEPPIGKDITSIDLIKNATVEALSFSLEEKHIMVQYSIKDKGTSLRVYDVDSGELIDFKFEEEFPMDKVDVKFSSFGEDALNFEVKEKVNTGKEEANLLGKWQLDLKEYKVKRL
ncbi:hypothetical protein [Clostridium thermarum]|uniref:hypothetical protein n=1 Tax=Clostridium thermarum TaxID=1716543 RepID=UPI00193FC747|nr:hypothetical protein [Clostridium thermarum]